MVLKKILVGVDGSDESRKAAATAADLARAYKARLVIAYVAQRSDAQRHLPADCDLAEKSYAAALLHQAEIEGMARGAAVEGMTACGPVAETLADLARTQQADLVVVGHRGRGSVARVLLGSVADRLTQISPAPVLITR